MTSYRQTQAKPHASRTYQDERSRPFRRCAATYRHFAAPHVSRCESGSSNACLFCRRLHRHNSAWLNTPFLNHRIGREAACDAIIRCNYVVACHTRTRFQLFAILVSIHRRQPDDPNRRIFLAEFRFAVEYRPNHFLFQNFRLLIESIKAIASAVSLTDIFG